MNKKLKVYNEKLQDLLRKNKIKKALKVRKKIERFEIVKETKKGEK